MGRNGDDHILNKAEAEAEFAAFTMEEEAKKPAGRKPLHSAPPPRKTGLQPLPPYEEYKKSKVGI